MTLNINQLQLEGKNIVIVDDDLPSIRYYETLLKNSGATLNIFHTGKEFVEYLSVANPSIDLVFMDFLIPLINGLDCIRIFRRYNREVPVIMITAYSSEQTKTDAYISGCTEYVLKPIYPEKICFLIQKYLKITQIPHHLMN
ncbi:MAG TPA: response regulator [Bacteroidales bacterium]|jgi:CheY-like chemotaxis protein|nr:response regulator [Bacteroidales bacterium]